MAAAGLRRPGRGPGPIVHFPAASVTVACGAGSVAERSQAQCPSRWRRSRARRGLGPLQLEVTLQSKGRRGSVGQGRRAVVRAAVSQVAAAARTTEALAAGVVPLTESQFESSPPAAAIIRRHDPAAQAATETPGCHGGAPDSDFFLLVSAALLFFQLFRVCSGPLTQYYDPAVQSVTRHRGVIPPGREKVVKDPSEIQMLQFPHLSFPTSAFPVTISAMHSVH